MAIHIAAYLADQNPHRDRSLGITNLTQTLLGEISRDKNNALTTISSKSSFRFKTPDSKEVIIPWKTDGSKVARIFTDNLHPVFLRSIRPDIWYYPKGYLPYFKKPEGIVITTIHDTLVQHYADKYPENRSKVDINYWLTLLKSSIKNSDWVFAVSETTKNHILDFCDRYELTIPNIHVTYEGSDFEDYTPAEIHEKEDYVIHLASQHPYKKTLHLLNWWKTLTEQGHKLPPLHLVGSYTEETKKTALEIPGVTILPRLDQVDFVDAIRKARALIFPSEFEGFGLPAIEAYFLNTPVIYTQNTSMEEIISTQTNKGIFNLAEIDSFVNALDQVLGLSYEDVENIGKGLRVTFSKKKYTHEVQSAFSMALGLPKKDI